MQERNRLLRLASKPSQTVEEIGSEPKSIAAAVSLIAQLALLEEDGLAHIAESEVSLTKEGWKALMEIRLDVSRPWAEVGAEPSDPFEIFVPTIHEIRALHVDKSG